MAILLACDKYGKCSSIIRRQNSVYPYAIVSISAAEGSHYGGGNIDTSSHNFAVMKSVLSTLDLNGSATVTNTLAYQSACYAYTSQTLYKDINHANVTAVDAAAHTITLQYYPASDKPLQLNEPIAQPTTQTFTIPESVKIVRGGTCSAAHFNDIHLNSSVNLYKSSASDADISTIYVVDG